MKKITLVLLLSIIGCDQQPQATDNPTSPRGRVSETEQGPVDGERKTSEVDPSATNLPGEQSSTVVTDSAATNGSVSSSSVALKLAATDCIDPKLDEVKFGVKLMLCDGTIATGTLGGADLTNLIADNIKAGVTINGILGSYNISMPDLTALVASNIKAGVTINGITGTLVVENHNDCSSNNQTGCIANTTYRAADITNLSAANVKSGVTIAGVTGNVVSESHSDCSANSQTGCVATSTYKAADLSNLSAANIKSGVVIAGVTGSVVSESHSDCISNAQVGCVSTSTYKAADLSNLSAANVKSGVVIAGITGGYPSSTYPLASATATADLDLATFNAKIKSSADFEWFDSNGTRYVNTGDADITAANLVKNVSIFGTVGTTDALPTIDPYDLRKGVTVGSVTGSLNTNCRDFAEGAPNSEKCFGDAFLNVTGPSPYNCTAFFTHCKYKDRITNLIWSHQFDPQTYANATNTCANLNIDGDTGWRLPEFAELVDARNHGMTNGLSASKELLLGTWTGINWTTSAHTAANSRWGIFMNDNQAARTGAALETNAYAFFCVK